MRAPYNTARWQRLRKQQLSAEPICAYCLREGKAKPASIADHIEPHRGDMYKFWHGELQSLCKRHHDSDKQKEERGGPEYGSDGWPV